MLTQCNAAQLEFQGQGSRRVAVSLSRACPCQDVFAQALQRVQAYPLRT